MRNVGGDRVEVTTLVGPNGDAHVYAPTPADAKTLADAKLVFVNGLGFEGWMPGWSSRPAPRRRTIVATKGITPRKARRPSTASDADPHAWQSVANAKIYVANIRDALVAADPAGSGDLRGQCRRPISASSTRSMREVKARSATIPPERRQDHHHPRRLRLFRRRLRHRPSSRRRASRPRPRPRRKDVAPIIRQIRAQKIPAVFLENITDPRLMQRIAAETGAKIGGTLYSDALTDEKGGAPTYIDMMRHNIRDVERGADELDGASSRRAGLVCATPPES